ncbi:hypothetical protein MKQ70_00720 [Chitinophaga sedimenti]|uniref:hypothetical protein n=1 Tax=Chitinophaga sedimenti TaxID=2033606 RepID=UPI0020054DF0|nr:hypothetical protein [Chitinophaga sedimenti]MCK7553604.1 hypothetical protein [Chitinophaga sedimenti]
MKKCLIVMLALLPAGAMLAQERISVNTDHLQLVFAVDKGKVYQSYFGEALQHPNDLYSCLPATKPILAPAPATCSNQLSRRCIPMVIRRWTSVSQEQTAVKKMACLPPLLN